MRKLLSLAAPVAILSGTGFAIAQSAPPGTHWGPNGSARSGDDKVWEAKCSNGRPPITGTCVVNQGGPIPLQNFGVSNIQWECAWTQSVRSATVRALCPGAMPSQAQTPPSQAQTKDVLVVAKHIDQVEDVDHLELLWKNLDTVQGRKVLDGITTYLWECSNCGTQAIDFVDGIVGHTKDGGEEHTGYIQAPRDYTVCHAYVESPSVTCNGTFTGSYRTADDPSSQTPQGRIDGLHWYIVVPKPAGVLPGRCWVEGTIVVTFVKAAKRLEFGSKCATSGTVAFHHGK